MPNKPNEYSVYATEAYYTGPDSRVRRFVYRVDGFVSFRGIETGGELLTKRLTFSGDQLVVNLATQKHGELRVEVQDHEGRPIDGFTLKDCEPLSGDSIKQTVRWKSGRDLRRLGGMPIRLRFRLSGGDLYAFQFLKDS